jgi:predicted nucleic acid-binding protein
MVDNSSYVDINIFVYWLGNHPKFGETAYKWIKKIEQSQRGKYLTSSLTLYETLVIVAGLAGKSLRDKAFTEEVITSITNIRGLTIEPLKPEDFTKAVELMEDYKLDYEDSLHLAVAMRTGAQEILSNDEDFDVTPIKRNM